MLAFVVKTVPLYLLLFLVALVAGGFTIVRFTTRSGSPDHKETDAQGPQTQRFGPKREAVTALGRIEPESRVVGVGGATGDRLARLLVGEGKRVKQNDELAYLQSRSERLAERRQIEASLREARAQLDAETVYGRALIREAECRVEQAEKLHPLKIASQEARVRAFEAELATARKDLDRATALRKDGTVTEADWDGQVLLVRQREEALQSGQATLDELKTERDFELRLAQVELERFQAALVRSQALVAVESLEKRLEQAEARLEQTVIVAPIAGRILKVLTWPGEPITQQPILQMGNTDEMHAVAEVYETDIQFVEVGQRATIDSPALSGDLTGHVVQIGMMIYKNDVLDVDPAADADARVVEVRIRLDEPKRAERLTNLQVNVRIDVPADAESSSAAVETAR